ncbi:acetyltransferase [Paenibacillus baekrokdamisoli]|uniref:Acetyltransferase n=1 Tax=Paenibacillus baekrokdamisoli TaxID=1712516 RepID=A0A3G9IMP2_9BACL|nr:acyltransferase [Paenibacillus baekrokdamisoli]MBB3067245.1 acetyltransferase-like isoleucine patch superfamily enzyme [Paenibacillus baekrokdamisoli]BBH19566.1 acetyltransferase [Paenibacillus baekrokdamisoli]
MRGRDLYGSAKPVLRLVTAMLRIVPKLLLIWLWTLSDWLPHLPGVAFRYCILKRLARRCGDNVLVGRGVEIRYWERLSIGSNVSIHKHCYLDAYGELDIEDEVSIAHQSSLVSFQHTWSDESLPIRDNAIVSGKIRICRDVWIGCGVRVLSGVEIGSRSVIAAGAVVTKNVSSGVVAAGVPAKTVKAILSEGKNGRSSAAAWMGNQ